MVEVINFLLNNIGNYIPLIRTIIIVVASYIIFSIIIKLAKKGLLKKASTKKQKSNIHIFTKVLKYSFFILILLIAIFSYSGSLTGLGLSMGLFSAALGWALQKPITGVAAWIMVVTRRPFEIGDRVIIGNVRGDVDDITITHIYIKEIGGIVSGEENSGRIIMVPNSVLFEKNIVNYTLQDQYVLDQVKLRVTFESDLQKAKKLAIRSAKKITKEFIEKTGKEPYARTYYFTNGIKILLRYFVPPQRMQEISSEITQEVHKRFKRAKNIEFAYPHRTLSGEMKK